MISNTKIWKCFWSMSWKLKKKSLAAQLCLTLAPWIPPCNCSLPGSSDLVDFPGKWILGRACHFLSGGSPNWGSSNPGPVLQADALTFWATRKATMYLIVHMINKEQWTKFYSLNKKLLSYKRINDKLWNEINYFHIKCVW